MQLKEASVLLVDDESVLVDIMREWLQQIVGTVFCAGDGVQALQVLDTHRIDLVITDIRMPVMDGITMLKEMKARGRYTPSLIFITGFADIDVRNAYDLGAEALVEKPIERDSLIDIMQRSLSPPPERWKKQSDLSASLVLSRTYASLSSSLQEQRIAFGRGGFCIEGDDFPEEEMVNIALDFRADGYVLLGEGAIRWSQENQMGIELTYVADKSLARLVQLTEGNSAFIPRTTESDYQDLRRVV